MFGLSAGCCYNPVMWNQLSSINLFKFACKQYMSYKDNQELKRSERIGDVDVEKLKADKIEEKSERPGFKAALMSLSRLENYNLDKNKTGQGQFKGLHRKVSFCLKATNVVVRFLRMAKN